jgi:hypothetical protein
LEYLITKSLILNEIDRLPRLRRGAKTATARGQKMEGVSGEGNSRLALAFAAEFHIS